MPVPGFDVPENYYEPDREEPDEESMTFDEWFLKFSSWGLNREQLVTASFTTPGRDPGDVVWTSPAGNAMTRHICSHWIDFHDAARMGWDAARKGDE
jgi:hypothetical protein